MTETEGPAPEGHVGTPPAKKKLLLLTGGALVVATLVAVCFVFPAEYHLDPLGVGKLTGLDRLAGNKEIEVKPVAAAPGAAPATPSHSYPTAWRSDVIDIPLTSADQPEGSELEYKVRMKPGSTLIYSWEVAAPPEEFYSDFHGQTIPDKPGGDIKVATYRQAVGIRDAGSLIAPLDGVHGWYLQNQSTKPTVVHLRIAGFYELQPPGQIGNEVGLKPRSSNP
jgi:hypothetical protein